MPLYVMLDAWAQVGGPVLMHFLLETRGLFSKGSPLKHEHLCLCAYFELAASADQLDLPQLLSAELLARRLSLLEKVSQEAKGSGKYNWSIADFHMGCPLLRGVEAQNSNTERDEYMAKRLRVQNAYKKEVRKDREERQHASSSSTAKKTS